MWSCHYIRENKLDIVNECWMLNIEQNPSFLVIFNFKLYLHAFKLARPYKTHYNLIKLFIRFLITVLCCIAHFQKGLIIIFVRQQYFQHSNWHYDRIVVFSEEYLHTFAECLNHSIESMGWYENEQNCKYNSPFHKMCIPFSTSCPHSLFPSFLAQFIFSPRCIIISQTDINSVKTPKHSNDI